MQSQDIMILWQVTGKVTVMGEVKAFTFLSGDIPFLFLKTDHFGTGL